jgi:DNA polymerase I
MSRLVFDVETNGFLQNASRLWCIATYDLDTHESNLYYDRAPSSSNNLILGLDALNKADVLIGHNICGFDIPVLLKLCPKLFSPEGKLIDTMLLNCILNPEWGTMSLEDWALKLKLVTLKIQHDDWSVYSEAMGTRCLVDVDINVAVYNYLEKQMVDIGLHKGILTALELEQDVGLLHSQQVQAGVHFDLRAATDLYHTLKERREELRKELVVLAAPRVLIPNASGPQQVNLRNSGVPGREAIKKNDGQHTAATVRHFDPRVIHTVKGPYCPIEVRQFNPDNSKEVQEMLLSLGWQPTEYNRVKDKESGEWRVTSPKLTEDSFESLPEGLGKKIGEYNTVSHRMAWLQGEKGTGAIPKAMEGMGIVSAEAFTCGTPTARYRHSGVVCNIPRPSSKYGKEFRSLFCVPHGYAMVGVDLSGIEARMLAHFILKLQLPYEFHARETADSILTGDFHDANAVLWGVDRDKAKSILYALMYGAGATKLGSIAGRSANEGARMKQDFYDAHPSILQLIKSLEYALDKNSGYIIGLDGRPLYVRRKNTALNTLLQNAATVVFKNWMIKLEELRVGKLQEDVQQIIAYHDELQYRVKDEYANVPLWMTTCEAAAEQVGIELKLLVPIKAKAKKGVNWKETH